MGSVRRLLGVGIATTVVTTGVVWEAGVVSAASFTQAPTRLYMTPAGESLPDDIAQFVGVQQGQLVFDGTTDPISQQVRTITVETLTGSDGCDLTEPPYDIDDCSRLQLGPVSHGRLWMGAINTIEDGDGDPTTSGTGDDVYLLPSGARIDDVYQVAAGSFSLGINGTPEQLNDALADLVYTPDPGYRYVGAFNPEVLEITVVPGTSDDNLPEPTTDNDSATHFIDIRVLKVNQFPSITAPGDKSAQAGVELLIPAATPDLDPPFTGTEFSVTDPDNDEDVDGDQANPPVAEDDLPDGEGDEMLLIGFLDCGVATTDFANGFHLRGGTFQIDENTIRGLVHDAVGYVGMPPAGQTVVDGVLDAIDAISGGLSDVPLATNDPTDYTSLFAGVGTMSDVQYALSQVTFLQPAENDTCTLWTAVSDLGNNGLPLQYFDGPDLELPMIGLDIDSFDITTGALEEIDVSFDTAPLYVDEGAAPVEAAPVLHISPAIHPEFTIVWEVNPRVGDPDVAGVATANTDFSGTFDNTLVIPENATMVTAPPGTNVFPDDLVEGNETFTFDLVLSEPAPPGWKITSTTPSRTVVIVDDDDPAAQIVSFADATLAEGDAGTTTMTFTVGLDRPADGTETVDVTATPGSATNPADFGDPSPTTVAFAPGATSATIDVPIVGDLLDEGDHSFTLTLSNPVDVTIVDGTATGTIEDDDETRTASIADASVLEGDSGTTNLEFTVTLDMPAKGTESLTVSTTDGAPGAVAPGDYTALTNQPVTFAAGETTATVVVVVDGDTAIELDETFTVTLTAVSNVAIGTGTATGTITNDDGVIAVSVNDVTVAEGDAGTTNATFTVSLAEPAVGGETITITTSDGTATAPGDYVADSDTLTFAPIEQTATFTVLVNGDTDVELDETFTVTLSAPVGLLIVDGTGVGTITNDDAAAVTVNQALGQADPTSTSPILFTVEFSGPVTGFDAGDVSFTGSTTDATLTPTVSGGPQTYTVSVAAVGATATGTVVASVPAGAATTGSVPSLASTSTDNEVTLEVDTTAPTVTVNQAAGQADPTSTSPIVFTVVFSEPVVGFATGDVTLAGTAGASTAVVTDSGDATTFSVAVSGMTQDGTVIASVGAGVATDTATNANLASTSTDNVVTYDFDEGDVTAPTVTVNQAAGQADPTGVSPILFTVVFSEPVVGFATGDVTLAGTAGATTAVVSGSGTTYTVAVSGMTQAGTVIATVAAGVATDAAANPNLASTSTDNTVTYEPDVDAPLTIDVPDDIVTGNDPGQAGAVVDFDPATTSGGVPPVAVVCDRTSGQFFPLGTTTVTCTATDGEGAAPSERFVEATVTATFTITVVDTEPPVIADPPDLVRGATSTSGVTVGYATPTATDNAGTPTVACSPATGTVFRVGVTTVTCTATDTAGNTATASFTVTVTAPASGGLPVTGGGVGGLLVLAALLLATGLASRRLSLRH